MEGGRGSSSRVRHVEREEGGEKEADWVGLGVVGGRGPVGGVHSILSLDVGGDDWRLLWHPPSPFPLPCRRVLTGLYGHARLGSNCLRTNPPSQSTQNPSSVLVRLGV